jgi:hypothetical protein
MESEIPSLGQMICLDDFFVDKNVLPEPINMHIRYPIAKTIHNQS